MELIYLYMKQHFLEEVKKDDILNAIYENEQHRLFMEAQRKQEEIRKQEEAEYIQSIKNSSGLDLANDALDILVDPRINTDVILKRKGRLQTLYVAIFDEGNLQGKPVNMIPIATFYNDQLAFDFLRYVLKPLMHKNEISEKRFYDITENTRDFIHEMNRLRIQSTTQFDIDFYDEYEDEYF